MISFVTWLWKGANLAGREFLPAHVNVLRRMVGRHYEAPHRFVCVTDAASGFDPGIEVFPTPAAALRLAKLPSPEGGRFPSCYRRLWAFSAEAAELGDRLVVMDVDLVILGDLAPLVARAEPFVGWRPLAGWGGKRRIGGGLYMLTPGARLDVWTSFQPPGSIAEARAAGFRGSDQAWLSYRLAASCPVWGPEAGLYSIRDLANGRAALPRDARLVQFNGPVKPWQSPLSWVRANWQ